MEENKKGFNSLYLVLGVATLVVAIIGATFAFFSASQTANNISGDVAEAAGLLLEVKSVTYDPTYTGSTGNNIVPLNLHVGDTKDDEGNDVDSVDQFDKAMAKKCRDDLGNNICEVYRITVKNQSTENALRVLGTLNLTSNAKNMHWMLINADSADVEYTPEGGEEATYEALTTAAKITGATQHASGSAEYLTVDLTGTDTLTTTNTRTNLTLEAGASKDFYVVVWLEEMGTAQETDDASGNYGAEGEGGVKEYVQRTYSGLVKFDAVDANGNPSGVTATFLS